MEITDRIYKVSKPFSYINYTRSKEDPGKVIAEGHYMFSEGIVRIYGQPWGKDRYFYSLEMIYRGKHYYRAINGNTNTLLRNDTGGIFTDIGLKRIAGKFGRECVKISSDGNS